MFKFKYGLKLLTVLTFSVATIVVTNKLTTGQIVADINSVIKQNTTS